MDGRLCATTTGAAQAWHLQSRTIPHQRQPDACLGYGAHHDLPFLLLRRVLEQYKADLGQRRLGAGGSSGGGSGGTMGHATAAASEQLQQGEPAPKRARVDSDSDLTGACASPTTIFGEAGLPAMVSLHGGLHCPPGLGNDCCSGMPWLWFGAGGSVAVSAAVKDGDRNVLKLKFARARKPANGAAAVRGVEQAAVPPSAAAFGVQAEEHVEVTGNQRSRPRRQVRWRDCVEGRRDYAGACSECYNTIL